MTTACQSALAIYQQAIGVHLNFKWCNWHRARDTTYPLFTHGKEYNTHYQRRKNFLKFYEKLL
jgi:hypothetical protein